MNIGSTRIVATFAEAFRLRYARIVVTAAEPHWLDAAVRAAAGYGTSVIGCDAEIGVERHLSAAETPDGRPGAALLAFGFSAEGVGKAVAQAMLADLPQKVAAMNRVAEGFYLHWLKLAGLV